MRCSTAREMSIVRFIQENGLRPVDRSGCDDIRGALCRPGLRTREWEPTADFTSLLAVDSKYPELSPEFVLNWCDREVRSGTATPEVEDLARRLLPMAKAERKNGK